MSVNKNNRLIARFYTNKNAIMLLLSLGGSSCFGGPIMIGYTNAVAVTGLTQSVMTQIGQYKWFFAHASVGDNIVSGLNLLHEAQPAFYRWTNYSTIVPPTNAIPGTFYEYNRGNPGWQPKVDWFSQYVTNGWRNPKVDIVINKLCWTDQGADVNYYLQSMSALEGANPQTTFVYATIPLETYENYNNYLRMAFNDALRGWVRTNNRILYDIADIECHDTNGTPQTYQFEAQTSHKLFIGYATADEGHLTAPMAQKLAASGLYALAAALPLADRDGDGIPDPWEMAYGLNPMDASDADTDLDNDGMTSVQEYQTGTNPNNGASVLKVRVSSRPDRTCQLEFSASSNIFYSVEYKSPFSADLWKELFFVTNQPYERNITLLDASSLTSSNRYYRVKPTRYP